MSRDWQKDMELIKIGETSDIPYGISEFKNMLPYYHQQYAAEKERADRAIQERKQFNQVYEMLLKKFKESEAREQKLREATEYNLQVMRPQMKKELEELLASLYPKEETKP